jgi:hypothetical protein
MTGEAAAMHVFGRSVVVLMLLGIGRAGWGQAAFVPPTVESLKSGVDQWLQPRFADRPELKEAVEAQWKFGEQTPTAAERSDALLRVLYLADDDVRELMESCRLGDGMVLTRDFRALSSHRDEPLLSNNVRAFYARFLATATLYEESLAIYNDIDLSQVADPAAALFYKAVCEHALLERDAGLDTLANLLDRTANVPRRYRAVGELMKEDLEGLKEKSLDEVAKQMSDVRRRLALGRAGEKVQRVEDRIVVTLDGIIKELEEQQKQQQSSGGGSGSPKSSGPPQGAEDSYNGGIKGQGLTDRKDIGRKDNWGDLPSKSQAAAKNMLENQFPAHYRLAVEEYLKRLAERTAPPQK